MGCGGSKVDRLPLVVRCKQRKQHIRKASAQRYKLAAAHRAYFRALRSTGDALQRFADEELAATAAAADAGEASPVLAIPSSDGKPKTPGGGGGGGGGGDGHLHISSSDDSHIVISGSDADADSDSVGEEQNRSPPLAAEMAGSPTYGYMRSSSSPVPTVVYEPPPEYYYYGGGEPVEERRPATPSPPRGEDSRWSFFNPFDFSYNESGYGYGYPRYGGGSELSSPDSGDVREKEGIPDLENDTDTEMDKGKEVGLGGESSNSKVGSAEIGESSRSKSVSEGTGNVKSVSVEQEVEVVVEGLKRKKNSVSFEMEVSPGDSIESLHTSSLSTLSSVQSRDMREVVEEIRNQFVVASEIGKEMDSLLEVGKVGYRPKNPILKVISCRTFDDVSSALTSSSRHNNRQYMREDIINRRSLSLTLEKLYAWEKKLHKEIKDEEKLRINFQKQHEKLKTLDDRGAEPSKIDATQELIGKLETKLTITIKTVAAISKRIHALRDEELQPQVIELFHGFMRLWTGIMRCHKKQLQAIVGSKRSSLIQKTMIRRDSSLRATWELERELRKWCACFDKWISTHKAYVKALNEWLLQCLLHEPEQTPDGIAPFSPSRIGAPLIFVVCNDWCEVLQRISEVQVTNAIHNFANTVHKLWESQDEERKQKIITDYVSRDIEMKLKSLHIDEDSLDRSAISLSNGEAGVLGLDTLKRRLEEERAKHAVSMKQVREAVSGSIEMGFIPIFEAMDKFSKDVVKGLEGVRTRATEQSSQR